MDQSVRNSRHWGGLNARQVANISGYIRENQGMAISTTDVEFLRDIATPSVGDKARKLLRALSKEFPTPGTSISPNTRFLDNQVRHFDGIEGDDLPSDETADRAALEMFPILSFGWAQDQNELRFLLFDYLCDGVHFLDGSPERTELHGFLPARIKISPAGWEVLQSFGAGDNTTGFVAMWFDESLNIAWEKAFYPAIKDAGYSPLRIDKREHNNKIDDEIIATIRGARFMVADFTGGRGGVYYEAGFAAGLDKPVIWTVRKNWLKRLHFDTRQYNHIAWEMDGLSDFRRSLQNRIEATLGRGSSTLR